MLKFWPEVDFSCNKHSSSAGARSGPVVSCENVEVSCVNYTVVFVAGLL